MNLYKRLVNFIHKWREAKKTLRRLKREVKEAKEKEYWARWESFKNDTIRQRRCYDCKFCMPLIMLWCFNEKAIKARGTKIPGIRNCPYYQPDYKAIQSDFEEKPRDYKTY